MRPLTHLLLPALATSAVVLSGCVTAQENPNYQFSSSYQGDLAAKHQFADAAPVATQDVVPVVYETAPAQPVFMTPEPMPAMTDAPTDLDYTGQDVSGTPGFIAVQGGAVQVGDAATDTAQVDAPAYTPLPPSAPQELPAPGPTSGTPVTYDVSQNLIYADTAVTPAWPEETRTTLSAFGTHTVASGDTVYSLARAHCVSVEDIRAANALDASFGIRIGQTLSLPASRC